MKKNWLNQVDILWQAPGGFKIISYPVKSPLIKIIIIIFLCLYKFLDYFKLLFSQKNFIGMILLTVVIAAFSICIDLILLIY